MLVVVIFTRGHNKAQYICIIVSLTNSMVEQNKVHTINVSSYVEGDMMCLTSDKLNCGLFADGLGVNSKADSETISLAILILGQVARPSLCQGTPRGIIDRELGRHCTHDRFYMHQASLAYMVVFD